MSGDLTLVLGHDKVLPSAESTLQAPPMPRRGAERSHDKVDRGDNVERDDDDDVFDLHARQHTSRLTDPQQTPEELASSRSSVENLFMVGQDLRAVASPSTKALYESTVEEGLHMTPVRALSSLINTTGLCSCDLRAC